MINLEKFSLLDIVTHKNYKCDDWLFTVVDINYDYEDACLEKTNIYYGFPSNLPLEFVELLLLKY